eukprot:NODE_2621_length_1377_cov_120.997608_g2491_i0.p1 GENE.NODE_2621_length_1377_cov_120.997608_g2491_i0~~NODE_2621_length_1377_cov_120.997608_g2491_i0.p1  ORF type:complete len:425 (-),score=19.68 NODE_2621_length_1377_cov_120.997608_g2491_i0:102-1241(-)
MHELDPKLDSLLVKYASLESESISVQWAIDYGKSMTPEKKITSAEFTRRELLVRLAQSITSFQNLPYIACINPNVHEVYLLYIETFKTLLEQPPVADFEDEEHFASILRDAYRSATHVVTTLSRGIHEIRHLPASVAIDYSYLDSFIDQWITLRMSRRVLGEHHLGLELHTSPDSTFQNVGIFNLATSPRRVIEHAMRTTQDICISSYGRCPPYKVECDENVGLTYITGHLQYMLLELCKNACKATLDKHRGQQVPEVSIRVCSGDAITIIIKDEGGGIPVNHRRNIWSYGFSTTAKNNTDMETPGDQEGQAWGMFQASLTMDRSKQLSGYGFGLPMCRAYARFLGGDLSLVSFEGHGTDAYLTLKSLDNRETAEQLFL